MAEWISVKDGEPKAPCVILYEHSSQASLTQGIYKAVRDDGSIIYYGDNYFELWLMYRAGFHRELDGNAPIEFWLPIPDPPKIHNIHKINVV